MKTFIAVLYSIFLIVSVPSYAQEEPEQSLQQLDKVLEDQGVYEAQKQKRLSQLRQLSSIAGQLPVGKQFSIYSQLYEEYNSYNYDSAFACIRKLQELSARMNDPVKVEYVKIKLGFILLSSGLFKEAFDSFNSVNSKGLPDSLKAEYYSLVGRAYYSLGDYNRDHYYTAINNRKGDAYIDSALNYISPRSYQYQYLEGLKVIKQNQVDKAKQIFQTILADFKLDYHQYAITASTLSDFYIYTRNPDAAISLLAKAAIADIKSSTRETTAILNLANLLYERGDVKRAYDYIKRASEDAEFYGARQRKIQVSAILPIIAGVRLATIDGQRYGLLLYSAIITLLSALVVVFAVIIFRQVKKLKTAEKVIKGSNHSLQQINTMLVEANKIKEKYIAYYFNTNSDYIEKLERLKKSVEQKLVQRKFDDISIITGKINLKREREELYLGFDKVFLSLFPNFVHEFNAFFKEEDQINLSENQLLNTELRIFALIRMGISDNEKIAHILDYSVNTIYTYKTRIKNRSLISNEEFEEKVMAIKSL